MRLLVALSVLLTAPALARADGAVEVPRTGGPTPTVLYLDRCPPGCTITTGATDDARTDTSSAVPIGGTLSPLPRLDLAWASLVLCLGETFGPYGIELATEEPGPDVEYVEVKISGFPEELGLPTGTRGLAPRADDCTPVRRGLAFVFGNLWDLNDIVDAPVELCGHVAHQVGHLLGLDDARQCRDPMVAGDACTPRRFVDQDVPCGDGAGARACACGGATQNGHAVLRDRFGAGGLLPPPHVEIVTPTAGADVEDEVAIALALGVGRRIARLELWVDGALDSEVAAPATIAPTLRWTHGSAGEHVIEARAFDDLDRMGGDAITVRWRDGGLCAAAGGASPATLAPVLLALALGARRRRARGRR